MYIFGRTTTVNRHRMVEGTTAAIEIADRVTAISGLPVAVFASRYGQPINTVRWSVRIDTQDELRIAQDKLVGDAGYVNWISAKSELFESAPQDQLNRVVSSTGMEGPKRFYTVLSATVTSGRMTDAVEFGVRAQQFVAEATGLTTAFLAGVYGPFGTVTWITGADSMAEIDSIDEMQMANPAYHALVKDAAPLFVEGSGLSGLIEKLN